MAKVALLQIKIRDTYQGSNNFFPDRLTPESCQYAKVEEGDFLSDGNCCCSGRNYSAVGRGIADSGCRFSANKYSGLTFNDSVYWPHAYRKITNPSSRLAFYQDGLTAGWNYWTPNMGHKYSYHWANMHITYSCGKRHIAILSNSEALEVPNKSFPNDSLYYDFNSLGLRLKTDY